MHHLLIQYAAKEKEIILIHCVAGNVIIQKVWEVLAF